MKQKEYNVYPKYTEVQIWFQVHSSITCKSLNSLFSHQLTVKSHFNSTVAPPKYWHEAAFTNSSVQDQTAPKEQSDLGCHCLPFPRQLLPYCRKLNLIQPIFRAIIVIFVTPKFLR